MTEIKDGFSPDEIQQAFLSVLFQWPDLGSRIVRERGLTEDHFNEPNKTMFKELNEWMREGKPPDLIAFTQRLSSKGVLQKIGGPYYVTHTWNVCLFPHRDVAEYYATLIEEKYALRRYEKTLHEKTKQTKTPGTDVSIIPETVEELEEIPLPHHHRTVRTLKEAVDEKRGRIVSGQRDTDQLFTGIQKLDHESPLRRGNMPIIVGERKAGKTILALTIATNIARQKRPVLIFSLENQEAEVIDRLIAGMSRVPQGKRRLEDLTPDEQIKISRAADELEKLPVHIIDHARDLNDIDSLIREYVNRFKIELAIIDYAQIVRVRPKRDQSREQVVAEISRTVRQLSQELAVPIILLSQLNEQGATRESRALEQDCTACWHVATIQDEKGDAKLSERKIRIPYQRNGPSGITFTVTFLGSIARVENYEEEGC